jgi:ankyrin repeat protein
MTDMYSATCLGRIKRVKELLAEGVDINIIMKHGNTPLINAAWYGHADLVNFLLEKDADVNIVNDHGNTVLHYAVEHGHAEVVMLLARVTHSIFTDNNNLRHVVNKDGEIAFDIARRKGFGEIALIIEPHSRVSFCDNREDAIKNFPNRCMISAETVSAKTSQLYLINEINCFVNIM